MKIFLIMWTVITFTFIFLVATLWTNWVVVAAFLLLFAGFVVLDVGSAASSASITHAGGYLEMLIGTFGWSIVFGELVNDTAGRAIFPFPLTPFHHLSTVAGEPQPPS